MKMSQYPELLEVSQDDLLVIVDSSAGETKKISVANLLSGVPVAQVKRTSAPQIIGTDTLTDIAGLSVEVEAGGIYSFRAVLHILNGAGADSVIALGGTATATSMMAQVSARTNGGTNPLLAGGRATAMQTGVAVGGNYDFIEIDGVIVVDDGGTLSVQIGLSFFPEFGNLTVEANCSFRAERITE